MRKKTRYFTTLIISMFLIFLTLYGCKEAGEKTVTETASPAETVIEDVATEEIEEIGEIETAEEEPAGAMDIPVERVYEIIESGEDYIILDVRNQDEYEEGHIEGAVLIPVSELEGRLGELPMDKPIITYCKAGSRSATASSILVENGFREVYNMGGISEWEDKGYPVVTGE